MDVPMNNTKARLYLKSSGTGAKSCCLNYIQYANIERAVQFKFSLRPNTPSTNVRI